MFFIKTNIGNENVLNPNLGGLFIASFELKKDTKRFLSAPIKILC